MSFAIGSLSITLGIGLTILGIVLQIRSNRKYGDIRANYAHTSGKIVKLLRNWTLDQEPAAANYPVVSFTTENGKEVTFVSKLYVGNLDKRVGEDIGVYYNPENPSDAIIDVRAAQFLPLILCGAFSIALFILAYAMFVKYPDL
ncbi:MAG TPA: DUF3592 domain-containing protein [Clostridia bacterium]|nr:DUF3592 domain-containing protein [Clostridia bacterium]